MYNSILIPIDMAHAEKGKHSLKAATTLAGKDTKVRLVNVVEDIPTFIAAQLPSGVIDKARDEASEGLKAFANAAGLKADTEVRSGRPHSAILSAAEDCEADLIIIGSHRPGMADYLLGSTAGRVVRHATCSVLVMR